MPIYRGDGGSGESNQNVYASDVAQDAVTASTKADEAAASASDAAGYASTAQTYQTQAFQSAIDADTSETNAAASATSAANSATAAATSETNAAQSETNASGSAGAASSSASAADTSATNAANSAFFAASNASTASTAASNAAASYLSAASSASQAQTSETNAAASATNAATSETNAATSATNAATSETNAATSATNAATSETNAANSATQAATSATSAATSATNASTSETNAASSATAAATSATAASTSESNASSSATSAATSATNASTSATNAASSATSAATSATNAAASYDSFDDRYLGPKASNPTTDNDGDALLTGALYYNTTAGEMRVYSGSVWQAAYISATGFLPTTGGTMTGALTLHADPSTNLQAATKQYVDTIAAASLHYHDPVRVEKEGNLNATYNNGTAGVGATLTNNNTQAALVIDGVTLSLNDRVLIYEQTNAYENGIYTVTDTGSASTNWVLTRATDADSYAPSDSDSLGEGDAFYVLEGTQGAGELYVMNTSGAITFGTTAINFAQVSSAQVYTGGTGITISGSEISTAALLNVVEDTTPQLGGTLDANGNNIDMGTNVITDVKVGQWSTAYGWGNHASAGYLVATTTDKSNWNSTYSTVTAKEGNWDYAYSAILSGESDWNSAYLWGDHSTAGYALKVGDTFTGNVTIASGNASTLALDNSTDSNYDVILRTAYDFDGWFRVVDGGGVTRFSVGRDNHAYVGGAGTAGNKLWDEGDFTSTNITNWNTAYTDTSAATNSATGSTLVKRTADGDFNGRYVYTSYVNMNHAASTRSSDTVFYSSTDNFIRKTNAAGMRASLGVAALSGATFTGALSLNVDTDDAINFSAASTSDNRGISFNARTAMSADSSDGWLRLNNLSEFTNGIYTPGNLRTDNLLYIGPSRALRQVTGSYGTVQCTGSGAGNYEGFSIDGRAVFMHDGASTTGLYNDVNNHWIFVATHNGQSAMYHAGSQKGYTYASGFRVTGNLLATSNVFAYYSDERLKDKTGKIENALDKVDAIETFYYTHNDKARELGYEGDEQQVGVSAQSVQEVMPEVVHLAPVDDDGEGNSVSGENYVTVDYPRLVPLLIESIKELRAEIEVLKGKQ